MKKWICVMLAVILLLTVFTTTVFASGHSHGNGNRKDGIQDSIRNCVSKDVCLNKDICIQNQNCSNYGICVNGCDFVDDNGDTFCDHCGQRSHHWDDDKDGICDNREDCDIFQKAADSNGGKKAGHHGRKYKNHH